jgi:hypothetical protein
MAERLLKVGVTPVVRVGLVELRLLCKAVVARWGHVLLVLHLSAAELAMERLVSHWTLLVDALLIWHVIWSK